MPKHYLFFTRTSLPQPGADLIQIVNCANAAANLGYSSVLTYLNPQVKLEDPCTWVKPFRPGRPSQALQQFYSFQERLQVAALPMPEQIEKRFGKWGHPSTITCKYYWPIYIRPLTQIVHTRDWNFVKAAIRSGIPAIYEHDHCSDQQFESEIVHHPLFQLTVTVADPVQQSLLEHGMPAEKIIKLHNGFNQSFLNRYPQEARVWRTRLTDSATPYLAAYSGALYPFKGVDLAIETAKRLPQVQFVFAGGTPDQVSAYQQLCRQQQVTNVQFLGHLPHEQLASLLQAADLLLHPHRMGEAATFTSPMKFFDYMASGTPIVATEIPPLMEFKPSGVVAGWCEPNHSQQLADCITHVLQTHPYRSDGYASSREFVRQFSWENRIATVLSHVKDALRPVLA